MVLLLHQLYGPLTKLYTYIQQMFKTREKDKNTHFACLEYSSPRCMSLKEFQNGWLLLTFKCRKQWNTLGLFASLTLLATAGRVEPNKKSLIHQQFCCLTAHWISCTFVQLGGFTRNTALTGSHSFDGFVMASDFVGHLSVGVARGFEFPHPVKRQRENVITVFHLLKDYCINRHWFELSKWWFLITVSAVSAVSSPSVHWLPGVNASKSDRALSTASSS